MSEADRLRWQARWSERSGDVGEPEPYLVRHVADLPPGPALVAPAGGGRNALWLAARGLPVTALDIAPAALARLERAAAARGLAVVARVADLDDQAALQGLGGFAALVVIRFRPNASQWPPLLAALRPGGRLLLCSFGLEHHRRAGFPRAFCLERDALERELGPAMRLLRWDSLCEVSSFLEGSLWETRTA
jgi:SAM-dependent methyltransferase